MNAKAQQKERTHDAILGSAARLLRSKGIAGARVADVMSGAGLTVGGFYAPFASKEALVDEVLRLTATRIPARHLALGLLALMVGGLGMARALRGTALSDEVIKACRAFGRLALRSEKNPDRSVA